MEDKSLEKLRLENERLQMEIKLKELELKEREVSILEKRERRNERIADTVSDAKNVIWTIVPVLFKIFVTFILSVCCCSLVYALCDEFGLVTYKHTGFTIACMVTVVFLPVSYYISNKLLKLIGRAFRK